MEDIDYFAAPDSYHDLQAERGFGQLCMHLVQQ